MISVTDIKKLRELTGAGIADCRGALEESRGNIKAAQEILKKKGIEVDFVEIEGKSILEKLFNNLILSDWVSYYLAKEYKIDPAPVEIVEELKKKLEE